MKSQVCDIEPGDIVVTVLRRFLAVVGSFEHYNLIGLVFFTPDGEIVTWWYTKNYKLEIVRLR